MSRIRSNYGSNRVDLDQFFLITFPIIRSIKLFRFLMKEIQFFLQRLCLCLVTNNEAKVNEMWEVFKSG